MLLAQLPGSGEEQVIDERRAVANAGHITLYKESIHVAAGDPEGGKETSDLRQGFVLDDIAVPENEEIRLKVVTGFH